VARTTDEQAELSTGRAETGAELAADVFTLSLRAIRDEIQALIAGKATGKKAKGGGRAGGDVTTRIANLSARAAVLAGELRKAEKAQLDGVRDYTRESVLTWARTQPREVRARLVKDLGNLNSPKGSVLG
jgi:hypothetical protein